MENLKGFMYLTAAKRSKEIIIFDQKQSFET